MGIDPKNRATVRTSVQSVSDDDDAENNSTQGQSSRATRSSGFPSKFPIAFPDSEDDDHTSYSS